MYACFFILVLSYLIFFCIVQDLVLMVPPAFLFLIEDFSFVENNFSSSIMNTCYSFHHKFLLLNYFYRLHVKDMKFTKKAEDIEVGYQVIGV